MEIDFLKKESAGTIEDKRRWIDPFHAELSIQRQCRLDELYRERPFFGSRRMAARLGVNRKRMQRLMRIAGIEALHPKPRLSRPGPAQAIHP